MPGATPPASSLQIFKSGRHTTAAGEVLAFSDADLAAAAAAYDPAVSEAPLVVGHPAMDGPAYGWVGALATDGSALEAQPRDVDPQFAELVNRRAYSKISAAFYRPDDPVNPKPGVWYLRHVGFLGAAAPAVKGLRTPTFAGDESSAVEFSEWDDATNANLWRNLREWFIGKFGRDEADTVIPSYQVGDLERGAQDEIREAAVARAVTPLTQPAMPAFATPPETRVTPEEAAALQAENNRLAAELAASQAAQQATARTSRVAQATASAVAFAEGLVAEAKVPKDRAEVVVAALVALAGADDGKPVEFGEGAARAPLEPAVRELLSGLQPLVEFAEVATGGRAAEGAAVSAVEFAAPKGAVVDPASQVLHRKVVAYQATHPGTDYNAALTAVQAGQR